MSRIPIRLRITLAFALAMAVLLGALGLFIYFRLESQLTATIDSGLRSRADDLAGLIQQTDTDLRESTRGALTEREEAFAQILTPHDRVFDTAPRLSPAPLLSPAELARALRGPITLERAGIAGNEGSSRLLATAIDAHGRQLVLVIGASVEDRDDALKNLSALLLIGGLGALLIASGIGYLVARGALRPMEAMRRQAAAISADELGERLSLPTADDEVRRLGETLNAMLGRIEAAIERERVFVDDASHELRTPLALHRTELELALRHGQTTTELRESIGSALEEIDRVIVLAEELLVLARADKGELSLAAELVPLADVVRDLAARFNRGDGVQVEVAVNNDEPVVAADRLRLEQALRNVIDNAVRHGGTEVRVSIEARAETVVIRVDDRGPGFQPEFLGSAFDRFSRAERSRTGAGVGLGLAITAAIVRAHGGTVRAENREGGGAEVVIELPLVA